MAATGSPRWRRRPPPGPPELLPGRPDAIVDLQTRGRRGARRRHVALRRRARCARSTSSSSRLGRRTRSARQTSQPHVRRRAPCRGGGLRRRRLGGAAPADTSGGWPRARVLLLVPHRGHDPRALRRPRRDRDDGRASRWSSTTTPRSGSTASCRSRWATRGRPGGRAASTRPTAWCSRATRGPGRRFHDRGVRDQRPDLGLAANYIWMRSATLDVYAPGAGRGGPRCRWWSSRPPPGWTASSRPTRASSGWPAASSSPRGRCGARTARCCSARRTRTRSTAGTRSGR